MTAALLAAAALLDAPAGAASPFLDELRKAEARDARDPERREYATRAIRAWTPEDGRALLAHAHFARAEAEALALDDEAAEPDLTRTLELDPLNKKALLLRSRARLGLGRGAEAEADAAEYASGASDDGEGWLALGEARLAQGLPKADAPAREAFAKAADELGSDDPRPSLGEGRARLAARKPRAALTAFAAAAERPKDLAAEAQSWMAQAQASLGDWPAARASLSKALPLLEARYQDRRRANAPARAVEAARGALADATFRRAVAHEALSRRVDALADYRAACDLGHRAACARADALARKPKPEPAPSAPKVAKPRRHAKPKNDAGERIYAN